MDLILAFIITFILLFVSVLKGIFLAYPLTVGLILFFIVAVKRGHHPKDVLIMALNGGKKSLIVIKVFILIGAIMAIWMASGTVPAIVFYGIKLIKPDLFILSAFIISCCVSFLIGTSVGTSGTVGLALMVIAKGGGVNLAATAGAILAGAYFGDRGSPMSSSASLVAHLTETNIYDNIKNMFKTCIISFIISLIFYTVISRIFPLHASAYGINTEIVKVFNINYIVILPALVIIILSVFKINVKISMMISIATAFFISIFIQHQTVYNSVKFMIFGFSLDKANPLYSIIKGGGVSAMVKTSLIVFVATAFAGIIESTGMLNNMEAITHKASSRYELFRNVAVTSIIASAVGCSQAFAIILTNMLNKSSYEKNGLSNSFLAIDLENTAIVIAPLIPWNNAFFAISTVLGANASCIPYSIYLFLLPLTNLLLLKLGLFQKSIKKSECLFK